MIQITLMESSFLCIDAAACVRVSACVSARAGVIHMQSESRLHPASQGCSPLRQPSLLRGRFSGERKDDGSRLTESERKCDVSPRQRQNLPCLFSEFKMKSRGIVFCTLLLVHILGNVGNVRFLLPESCLGCLPSIVERDSGTDVVFTPVFFQSVS